MPVMFANLAKAVAASVAPIFVDSPKSIIVFENANTFSVFIPNWPAASATFDISTAVAGNSLAIPLMPFSKSAYDKTTLPFESTTSSTVFLTPANADSKSIAALTLAVTPATIGAVTPTVHFVPKLVKPSPTFFALSPTACILVPAFVQFDS